MIKSCSRAWIFSTCACIGTGNGLKLIHTKVMEINLGLIKGRTKSQKDVQTTNSKKEHQHSFSSNTLTYTNTHASKKEWNGKHTQRIAIGLCRCACDGMCKQPEKVDSVEEQNRSAVMIKVTKRTKRRKKPNLDGNFVEMEGKNADKTP